MGDGYCTSSLWWCVSRTISNDVQYFQFHENVICMVHIAHSSKDQLFDITHANPSRQYRFAQMRE